MRCAPCVPDNEHEHDDNGHRARGARGVEDMVELYESEITFLL